MDYEKAFDTVNRTKLWQKLIKAGIGGKIFNVITNMYRKAKSCIRVNGKFSNTFPCNTGVRQGDNLSPLLFAIFINDFDNFLRDRCNGLQFAADELRDKLSNEDIEIFIKLFVLLYADDAVLLAETETDLQSALTANADYSKKWNLKINVDKTKIMVFSKGKITKVRQFAINGQTVEKVDSFRYLGIVFNYNGSFQKAIKHNVGKASNALYKLLNLTAKLDLKVQTTLNLFDKTIVPILLYGCEVWGYENLDQIEIFHRKFLRRILGISKNAPNCMTYGELGRYKLDKQVWKRMISFWLSMNIQSNKLSHAFFNYHYNTFQTTENKHPWITKIKSILDNAGISTIFDHPNNYDHHKIVKYLKNHFVDISMQEWHTEVNNNSLCNWYKLHKMSLNFEMYIKLLNPRDRKDLARFRCASFKFPHVKKRYNDTDCRCPFCDTEDTPDECHLLLKCPKFDYARRLYLHNKRPSKTNSLNYVTLMNSTNKTVIKALSDICGFILSCL